jgi:undecaprenyl phosphate-alpha-L-ara4FN deformylase
MLRSNAPSLYGPHILLSGTVWPGKHITPKLSKVISHAAAAGHEIGLHAWDHQAWQAKTDSWSQAELEHQLRLGLEAINGILGHSVTISAAPGWRADDRVLAAKAAFPFSYNSDCRGQHPFRPLLPDGSFGAPQVPVNLPTFDEVIGRTMLEKDFNEYILKAMLHCADHPVYTIHAEVEGVTRAGLFGELLQKAEAAGIKFCPLGNLLPENLDELPLGRIERSSFPGREGWLGCQADIKE